MSCANARPEQRDAGDWLDFSTQRAADRFLRELQDGLDRLGWAWRLMDEDAADAIQSELAMDAGEARQHRHAALGHRTIYAEFCREDPCSPRP